MGGFLRQSTAAQSVTLGPFLDDTDYKTPETGLTIANTDIKLVANGAASVNKTSGGGTHRVNGEYGITFDATDSATVGELTVSCVVAGALPVFDKFQVVTAAVFDALFASTATMSITTVGSVTALGAQAKLDVNAEVVDALSVDTYAEPGSVPPATASLADKIGWQQVLARNAITQTITTQEVRNDADSAAIGTATVSDDGTTAIRGEFA